MSSRARHRATTSETPSDASRLAHDGLPHSLVPPGEPSPEMVRALIAKAGHTTRSAAEAIGVSHRTMRRYVRAGPRWRRPRPVLLAALNVLTPPNRRTGVRR